jgi:acetyl-CoA acetyltransferase
MRDVAVVGFAQSKHVPADDGRNEVEILMPVVAEAVDRLGIDRKEIGFVCSGSCDYLLGVPFSFVTALDAIGAWPPIQESHVEQDAAWAFYEAWVRLQHGDLDTALVYGFGKSSLGDLHDIMTLQLDPYYLEPLWPDMISVAALQARAYLDASGKSERDLAEVAVRSRTAAKANPNAIVSGDTTVDALLGEATTVSPLRPSDCPPISDGAAVVILAAGDRARELSDRPAWVRGIDHRIEAHSLGVRDLAQSSSTRQAAARAGAADDKIDVAELHAQFTHEELILRDAIGLDDRVTVNPSGGPLAANPVMATGLIRIGEAADRISAGDADRAVAHASSGPCLQHNLVAVLEGA